MISNELDGGYDCDLRMEKGETKNEATVYY